MLWPWPEDLRLFLPAREEEEEEEEEEELDEEEEEEEEATAAQRTRDPGVGAEPRPLA